MSLLKKVIGREKEIKDKTRPTFLFLLGCSWPALPSISISDAKEVKGVTTVAGNGSKEFWVQISVILDNLTSCDYLPIANALFYYAAGDSNIYGIKHSSDSIPCLVIDALFFRYKSKAILLVLSSNHVQYLYYTESWGRIKRSKHVNVHPCA